MENIYFVTLSIGVNYTRDYTLRLIGDVLSKTPHMFVVTTDVPEIITEKFPNNERIKITYIDKSKCRIRLPIGINKLSDDFNFNLRYNCLEALTKIESGVAIFTDCDNSLEWWDEDMVQEYIQRTKNLGYNFLAPRTTYLFKDFMTDYNQRNVRTHGIFWHKIYNFDLDTNPRPEWDNATLPAEYMLIFLELGDKMQKFYDQWKWMHDYLVNKDYTEGTWAEGFEIGVSALVAGYTPLDIGWNHEIFGRVLKANGYKIGHPTEKQ